jgi:hypothetical protein
VASEGDKTQPGWTLWLLLSREHWWARDGGAPPGFVMPFRPYERTAEAFLSLSDSCLRIDGDAIVGFLKCFHDVLT